MCVNVIPKYINKNTILPKPFCRLSHANGERTIIYFIVEAVAELHVFVLFPNKCPWQNVKYIFQYIAYFFFLVFYYVNVAKNVHEVGDDCISYVSICSNDLP